MKGRVVVCREYGKPFEIEEYDVPNPEPGAVLLRMTQAGICGSDLHVWRGDQVNVPLPPTGRAMGHEGTGAIAQLGEGITTDTLGTPVHEGDRVVYSSAQGSYATHQVVEAWKLVPIPAGISTELAAAVHLQGLTAHYLSESTFPLKPGDTALIHAAAGGVGGLLVQLAKRRGARVIATAGKNCIWLRWIDGNHMRIPTLACSAIAGRTGSFSGNANPVWRRRPRIVGAIQPQQSSAADATVRRRLDTGVQDVRV